MTRACKDITTARRRIEWDFQPVVFGGYNRDMMLGAKPVDMDIHLLGQKWSVPKHWLKLEAGEMVERTGDESFFARFRDPEYMGYVLVEREMKSLGYYDVPGVDVPVNIVNVSATILPETLMELSDFGITQMVYLPHRHGLLQSNRAMADLRESRMTWNGRRGLDELPRSRRRAERITQRLAIQGLVLAVDFSDAEEIARSRLGSLTARV
jgi:hypothetical protein